MLCQKRWLWDVKCLLRRDARGCECEQSTVSLFKNSPFPFLFILIKEENTYNLLYEKERTTKTNYQRFSFKY